MANLNTNALWSAVKRKNIQDILEIVFTEIGEADAAAIARETTRMTDAAITRMKNALSAPEEEEVEVDDVEETEVEVEDVETQSDADDIADEMLAQREEDEISIMIKDVEKAIAKGKKKKAKKAFAILKESGLKGSVVDGLKKQIKKMEK